MSEAASIGLWHLAGVAGHLAGACAAAMAAMVLVARRGRYGRAGSALVASLVLLALWSLSAASLGPSDLITGLAEALRDLAFVFALYRLFAEDGRHESVAQVRPVLGALAFAGMLQTIMLGLHIRLDVPVAESSLVFHLNIALRLLVTVGGLVLVHNLYVGSEAKARALLRWPALALGVIWGFDLNLYTLARAAGLLIWGYAFWLLASLGDRKSVV